MTHIRQVYEVIDTLPGQGLSFARAGYAINEKNGDVRMVLDIVPTARQLLMLPPAMPPVPDETFVHCGFKQSGQPTSPTSRLTRQKSFSSRNQSIEADVT